MQKLIGRAYHDLPWHYDKGDEISVLFRTDRDALASLLPPVMTLPDGPGRAMLTASHHVRSTFGPYVGVYLGFLALHRGKTVLHRIAGMKTSFSGTAAGRELWAMPLVTGEPYMTWEGDVLNVVARRQGKDFARLALRLERRVDEPESPYEDMTSVAHRAAWDKSEKRHVLLGSMVEPADPRDMVFWKADASLTFQGSDPGDDWSLLPVHEVLEAGYSFGGHSGLAGPTILEEF